MNEFLQLILTRIEEKTSWGRNELKVAILEEYAKMGGIKSILESALQSGLTTEGLELVIRETLKEFSRES